MAAVKMLPSLFQPKRCTRTPVGSRIRERSSSLQGSRGYYAITKRSPSLLHGASHLTKEYCGCSVATLLSTWQDYPSSCRMGQCLPSMH